MSATILSIDTSTENIVIAISRDGETLLDERHAAEQNHSRKLIKLIDDGLKKTSLNLVDIDAFACTTGPGSFTGLRTGLGTIKGFCYALQKPLIGVPTLYAMAYPCIEYGTIAPVLEAKKDFVYTAIFQYVNEEWIEKTPTQMIPVQNLPDQSHPVVYIGATCKKYNSFFPEKAIFGNSKFDSICGKTLTDIAYRKYTLNEWEDVQSLEPLYIQKTAAEGYV